MIILLLLLFESCGAKDNGTIAPYTYFRLNWNFNISPNHVQANCTARSLTPLSRDEKYRYGIDLLCPRCSTSKTDLLFTEFGPIATLEILDPIEVDKGNYTCVLYDSKDGDKQIQAVAKEILDFSVVLSNSSPFSLWIILLFVFIGLIILMIVVCFIPKIRRKLLQLFGVTTEYGQTLSSQITIQERNAAYLHEDMVHLRYDARYEIEERNLERLECIGGGHFGTVFNGNFKVSQQWPSHNPFERYFNHLSVLPVAMKVPGDEDGLSDIVACHNILEEELKILCTVGSHPNIVTLVGAVTKSNNMCIIVEKCSNGNLLNFLKSRRDLFVPQFKIGWTFEDILQCGLRKSNRNSELPATYKVPMDKSPWNNTLAKGLTTAHLFSFSMQIALGINYLASMKCLHRDLAARNVLVTENMVCKIADFGLAKRMNRNDYYRVTTNYDLPLRWMSLEAVTDLKFTIESDVWSFGILLYEIFSLGGCPYPSIPNSDVMEAIGNRVLNEQPEFCPSIIYNHMLSCWDADPVKRPSFASAAELFHNHLLLASHQLLHNVDKELSRERHRQNKLESLRSRTQNS